MAKEIKIFFAVLLAVMIVTALPKYWGWLYDANVLAPTDCGDYTAKQYEEKRVPQKCLEQS